jgi:hypothetical protein
MCEFGWAGVSVGVARGFRLLQGQVNLEIEIFVNEWWKVDISGNWRGCAKFCVSVFGEKLGEHDGREKRAAI